MKHNPHRRGEKPLVHPPLRHPMRTPRDVFEDHLRLAQEGRFDEDLQRNYATDVKILMGQGVYEGHEGTRRLAVQLEEELPSPEFTYTTRLVMDDVAFLEWTGKSPKTGHHVQDGADTFVIRDGKVVVQTIHYTLRPPDTT